MFVRFLLTNSSSDVSDSDGEMPSNLIPMSARNNPYQIPHADSAPPLSVSVNNPQLRKHLR